MINCIIPTIERAKQSDIYIYIYIYIYEAKYGK